MQSKVQLNPPQQQAVNHINGPLLLLSGAGSGKTKVITHRIAHIIQNGIPHYNILAITFTNKAAKEMKERLQNLLTSENNVWISTFHSLCVRILRVNIDKLGYDKNFTIYDATDSQNLLKECIKELNINDKMFTAKSISNAISNLKDNLITEQQYEVQANDIREKTISQIYTIYQNKLKQNNALDFDDIISKTIEVFNENEEVLQTYGQRFKYIMVDEYQDTNLAQYTLIKLLAKFHENLCVVGDDDQSIYGWRGANIRNILDFEKDFKGTKVIKLEQNYRSTGNILEAANCVIQNNITRKSKSLWTNKESGSKLKYIQNDNDIEEANFLVNEIKEKYNNYSNIAVLYRKNSLSRIIEDAFVKGSIPYKIFGGLRFYDRKEIKDIMAYLIAIHNQRDGVSLKRIINVPKRGIGSVTINKIAHYASQNDIPFYDALKSPDSLNIKTKNIDEFIQLLDEFKSFDGSISELIKEILRKTNYEKEELGENSAENISRIENIGELISKAVEFEINFSKNGNKATLSDFLEEVSLVADIDSLDETKGYVSLMTVHSSKGLEFDCVFLVGFEDGIFPSLRNFINEKELEEERRLCYVAITRAINTMYLSVANQRLTNGRITYGSYSRFFKEIPKELIETLPRRIAEPTVFKNEGQKTQKGLSQYAEIKIFNDKIGKNTIGKNYKKPLPVPENITLEFEVGDLVNQEKYGNGIVKEINAAGKDYEIAIDFDGKLKRFMANFSKITKV